MKELEKEFIGTGEVDGFQFKQVASSQSGYMYEITGEDGNRHYECFERKEQQESDTVMAGMPIHYEAKVRYPKSNDFGVWAWCIGSEKRAKEKFDSLGQIISKKKLEL